MTQPVRRPSARIVIVNWRQAELTIRAARSIREQLGDGDVLVIVDNASGDGSVERLRREGLTVVESSENLGFGAGVNLGAQGMVEDVLVLLNNDAVAEPDFLEALLRTLSDPPSATAPAAATARILLAGRWRPAAQGRQDALVSPRTGRWTRVSDEAAARGEGEVLVNSTGNQVDASGNGYDRDWLVPAGQEHSPSEVFGLCGGACAIRREAWQALGGFREDLFMYYEDTDLSWRLRERGWRVVYVREAVVLHEHASSSGTGSAMFIRVNTRNRILTAAAHSPAPVVMQALARTVVRALRGPQRGPVMTGLAQAVAGLPRELRQRSRGRARRPSRIH
ncbi:MULTISPECIES: glycosyltransferase family 2 protein [Actinomyces]|uniref:Glycosyl transferase family 2 n=1 Tax=Actinomyces oris TaxID=544580 RepID=A0A1Q8VSH9_9ACTO|nr:glycosyltransferase family 2 protein [Actinomyces oris]OLO51062.1 glycosyl transferase family 2 [Actinomyces oris]